MVARLGAGLEFVSASERVKEGIEAHLVIIRLELLNIVLWVQSLDR